MEDFVEPGSSIVKYIISIKKGGLTQQGFQPSHPTNRYASTQLCKKNIIKKLSWVNIL